MIVNPGRGDVGVAEPLLHLGNVCLMVERIGGRRRPQRMRADFEAQGGLVQRFHETTPMAKGRPH